MSNKDGEKRSVIWNFYDINKSDAAWQFTLNNLFFLLLSIIKNYLLWCHYFLGKIQIRNRIRNSEFWVSKFGKKSEFGTPLLQLIQNGKPYPIDFYTIVMHQIWMWNSLKYLDLICHAFQRLMIFDWYLSYKHISSTQSTSFESYNKANK